MISPALDYDLLLGPVFIGSLLNWGFFGILTLQTFYSLFFLEAVQLVLATKFGWEILALGWGDPTVFAGFSWSGVTIPIMSGFVSAIIQLFFARRIWVLKTDSLVARCFSILIVLAALLQSSSAFAGGIKFALASYTKQFSGATPIINIWLSGTVFCDFLIAGNMIWILLTTRGTSTSEKTGSPITELMLNAVGTGTVTAVSALADTLFVKMRSKLVYKVPTLLFGKMYSISVLVMLNGRLHARSAEAASHVPSRIVFYHSNCSDASDAGSIAHISSTKDDITTGSSCNDTRV